ncbi:MAG: DUF6029 family protein [Alistipes sp.]
MKIFRYTLLTFVALTVWGMGAVHAADKSEKKQKQKQEQKQEKKGKSQDTLPTVTPNAAVEATPDATPVKVSVVTSVTAPSTAEPATKKKRDLGRLSGSFETNTIIYQNDAKTGAVAPDHNYGSHNYLKLDYQLKRFSVGVQAEWNPQVLQGYEQDLHGIYLPEKYIAWTDRSYSITLGDFYEQFGSGLILRAWEDRALGFNNSLGGARATFNIKNILAGKFLYAFPRYYMEYSSTQIFGGDLSLSLSNAIGMKDHSLEIEGSVVNRYERKHPESYTTEKLGFKISPNVVSYSARVNYEWEGLMAKFEYVGKGKDLFTSPLTAEQESVRGSAQLAEIGYSTDGFSISGMFRRLKNMQQLMWRTEQNPLPGNTMNYIPALSPQHSYILATLDPYTPNVFGEMGGQLDMFYSFKRGSALGGKRGMKVHANFSMYYSLDGATFVEGNNFLFREFTFDIDKSWNKKLRTILFVSLQKGALHSPNETVDLNTFVGDITYKFTPKFSMRAELQYLYTPDDKNGDWVAAALEMSFAPKWSVFGSWTYNYGGQKIHYYSAGASFTHSFVRVAMSYGRNKAGFVCSGGVCRSMPAYTGGNLQLTLTF